MIASPTSFKSGNSCCPSVDVRSLVSLHHDHDRCVRIYLGISNLFCLLLAFRACSTPSHSLAVLEVHAITDSEGGSLTRSQIYLILSLYLVPTRRSIFRECSGNSYRIGTESTTSWRKRNAYRLKWSLVNPSCTSLFITIIYCWLCILTALWLCLLIAFYRVIHFT